MFNNLNKPAFGTTATNTGFGFGANTNQNPFGQSQLFGKPAASTFGATPAFGQPSGSTLFAASQPQNVGLFQTPAAPSFGTTSTAPSGFGTTTLFGSTPQQQPSSSGLFGSNAFGQQNKPAGFGFGSSVQQTSIFGQPQPPAQQTSSLFQSPAASSVFGAGTSTFGGTQTGTGVVKFVPLTGTDTMQKGGITSAINTKHHCITCMKEYEAKSLEELRWEDYQAGRKGPQQQAGFGAMPFQSTGQTSIFGQPENKPAFGQPVGFGTPSTGFGMTTQSAPSQGLFGKMTTSTFGTATTASSFGFGTNTATSSPFGAASVNKTFGAPTTPSLFGMTTTQTPVFGSNTFTQQTAQNTGGLFGKPAQQPSVFNGSGFSFMSTPATQSTSFFSPPKPSTTFPNFGQTQTSTNFAQPTGFGQTSQLSFGNTFGKPAATSFGQPTQSTFGGGLGLPQNTLFGSANKPGGLFAGTSTSTGSSIFGGLNLSSTTTPFAQQPQQQLSMQPPPQIGNQELRSLMNVGDHLGHLPVLDGLAPIKPDYNVRTTNPKDIEVLLNETPSVKVQTGNMEKVKVMPLSAKKMSIFDSITDPVMCEENVSLRKSRKRLLIKNKDDGSVASQSSLHVSLSGRLDQTDVLSPVILLQDNRSKTVIASTSTPSKDGSGRNTLYPVLEKLSCNEESISLYDKTGHDSSKSVNIDCTPLQIRGRLSISQIERSRADSTLDDEDKENYFRTESEEVKDYCGVKLTRPEYYTIPPLEELEQYLDKDGRCIIEGFTVGRVGYGNVYFPDKFDVSNINLDEDVHFRHKELTIYPDDSNKPPVGEKLNRPAQVTLDRIWPRNKEDNKLIIEPTEIIALNFSEHLQKLTDKMGAKFVEYRPVSGSWVFMVDHFTKYGLCEGDTTIELEKLNGLSPISSEALKTIEGEESKIKQKIAYESIKQHAHAHGDDRSDTDEPQDVLSVSSTIHSIVESEDDTLVTTIHRLRQRPMPRERVTISPRSYSKNIQLMKACFFTDTITLFKRDDFMDDYDDSSIHSSPVCMIDESDEQEAEAGPSSSVKEFNIISPCHDIPLMYARNSMEAAVFKAKSFKVGWMRGKTFITTHAEFIPGEHYGGLPAPYKVQLMQFDYEDRESEIQPEESIIQSLVLMQQQCDVEIDADGCPSLYLINPLHFAIEQQKLADRIASEDPTNAQNQFFKHVWNLFIALWGPDDNSPSSRRKLFSNWLEQVVQPDVEKNIILDDVENVLSTMNNIFVKLTGHKIKEASELAIARGFPQLSLLISQCSASNAKSFIQKQLHQWTEMSALRFLDEDMVKIYMLIAGLPLCENINVCKGLTWLQTLALHLWYMSDYHLNLTNAVELYSNAFFRENRYACRPDPPYTSNCSSYSVLYHMMLLYSNRELVLNQVTNPTTYTNDMTDYRLSWLLMQAMSALNIGKISENGKNHSHTNFALQLEHMGHWEFAIFVLLFMKDSTVKKNLIMSILHRNMPSDYLEGDAPYDSFLVNDLRVPLEWIHSVLACKCRLEENYFAQYENSLIACDYKTAHNLLLEQLIPDLIISHQYKFASDLLMKLEDKREHVENWEWGAGLILDVLELREYYLENEEFYPLEIQDKLFSVCQRIKKFPCHTPKLCLCISDVSKSCCIFLQLMLESGSLENDDLAKYYTCDLVMPPDYMSWEMMKHFRMNDPYVKV